MKFETNKKFISLISLVCIFSMLVSCKQNLSDFSSSGNDANLSKRQETSDIISEESNIESNIPSKSETTSKPKKENVASSSQNSSQSSASTAASNAVESQNDGTGSDSTSGIKIVKKYDVDISLSEGNFSYEIFNDSLSGKQMPYRLHIPADHKSDKKYPVILFLHGAGEIGSDNQNHINNFAQGFSVAGDILSSAVIVCPQTPMDWSMDGYDYRDQKGYLGVAKRIVDYVINQYNGDRDRIYLTGLSLGSFATWKMLDTFPNFFAASVPVCGGTGYYASQSMIDTPIWLFHGTEDSIVPYNTSSDTYDAIKAAGGEKVKLTSLPFVDHNAWDYAYTDRTMFSWMFAQKLGGIYKENGGISSLFEISTQNGNAIVTENDIEDGWYVIEDGEHFIDLYLTENANDRLKTEYSKNKNRIFSFKFCDKNIYDFKFITYPQDSLLRIERTMDVVAFKRMKDMLIKPSL